MTSITPCWSFHQSPHWVWLTQPIPSFWFFGLPYWFHFHIRWLDTIYYFLEFCIAVILLSGWRCYHILKSSCSWLIFKKKLLTLLSKVSSCQYRSHRILNCWYSMFKYRELRSLIWRRNFIQIMNYFQDYAKRWAQSEKEDLDILSEWVKSIRCILKSHI